MNLAGLALWRRSVACLQEKSGSSSRRRDPFGTLVFHVEREYDDAAEARARGPKPGWAQPSLAGRAGPGEAYHKGGVEGSRLGGEEAGRPVCRLGEVAAAATAAAAGRSHEAMPGRSERAGPSRVADGGEADECGRGRRGVACLRRVGVKF